MATSAHGKWTEEQETSTQDVGCMYKKQDKNGIDNIDPEDSVSQVSHLSRTSRGSSVRSSASLLRLQEKQRQTELMARADAVKEQNELEMARRQVEMQFRKVEEEYKLTLFELKNKEEKLKLHTELNVSAVKLQALERYEEAEEIKSVCPLMLKHLLHIQLDNCHRAVKATSLRQVVT